MYLQTDIMLTVLEQKRLRDVITDTVTVLCQSSLNFKSKFTVEGLLGITIDDKEVILINVHEIISARKGKRHDTVEEKSANTVDNNEHTALLERHADIACATGKQRRKKSSLKQTRGSVPCPMPQNMFPCDEHHDQLAQSFEHETVQSHMPSTTDKETLLETSTALSSNLDASRLISNTSGEVLESQSTVKEESISQIDALDTDYDCIDRDLLMECSSIWTDKQVQICRFDL